METVHIGDAHTKGQRVPIPGNRLAAKHNKTYLRVRNFGTGNSTVRNQAVAVTIPGSEGACYGSAVVAQDPQNAAVLWAFATPNGGSVRPRSQVLAFWSKDPSLRHWHKSVAIQLPSGWEAYNTDVTAAEEPDHFVMAVELGAPLDVVRPCDSGKCGSFMTAFWRSPNAVLSGGWQPLPPQVYGLRLPNSEGAACPTIRFFQPWFYLIVLVLEDGVYQEAIARSRDLSNWTLSAHNPILQPFKAEDSLVMQGSLLQSNMSVASSDRALLHNTSEGEINTSDIDFVQTADGSETLIVYLWGTQKWLGFGAAAVVHATPDVWLASYF
eukprot:SAG31_NODE_184_length_20985_cov_28.867567_6_plen_325_part_00